MHQTRLIIQRPSNRRSGPDIFLRGQNSHGGVVRPMSCTSPDGRSATHWTQAVLEAPERFQEGNAT
jgi:hypothetical protein